MNDTTSTPVVDAGPKPVTVRLTKPILSFGEPIKEITFRVPTAADILRNGIPNMINPFDDPPRVDFKPREMNSMMAALGNVPSPSLAGLSPGDWMACAWAISRFFMPTPGAEVEAEAN